MNSKLCKKLRRDAEFCVGHSRTIYHNIVVKKVNFPTTRLGEHGVVPEFKVQERIKRVLGECFRKTYKQLKQKGKQK